MSLTVRSVKGRYPLGLAIFRDENAEVQVYQRVATILRIRFDDRANADVWLEIEIEIAEPDRLVTDDIPF